MQCIGDIQEVIRENKRVLPIYEDAGADLVAAELTAWIDALTWVLDQDTDYDGLYEWSVGE